VVSHWDRAVVEAFQQARWGPADWLFELLSEWWVKSLVIVGVGLLADLRARRPPVAAALATASFLAAAGIVALLKQAFARPRPPLADTAVHPLVPLPASYSMPSSHAATAVAAALAVGLVHSRLRWPLLLLAGLVAVSRVWLGVHYLTDVLVGSAIGALLAAGFWLLAKRALERWGASSSRSKRVSPGGEAGSPPLARPRPSGHGR
jgi:membrane-associated phospholipid phosphatase